MKALETKTTEACPPNQHGGSLSQIWLRLRSAIGIGQSCEIRPQAKLEMSRLELLSEYEKLAPEYDKRIWFDQTFLGVSRLRRQLFSKADGAILDIACGTGLNFPWFKNGEHITGVDLSPDMLELATEKAARLGIRVDLQVMDAEHLIFADNTFDTVTSALSTCTFPDPIAALREMRRVCKPGGQILLLEHGHSSLGWMARDQDRKAEAHFRNHAGCRWNQDPVELAKASGMKTRSVRRSMLGVFYAIEAEASK